MTKAANYINNIIETFTGFVLKDRDLKLLLLLSAVLVLSFVIPVMGWDFISPYGSFWEHPIHDPSTYYSSLLFYLEDSWHFPIFHVERMNYPDSSSLIYTDAIPFLALFAKIFRFAIPDGWHYFGYVEAASTIVNIVSFNWLIFRLGVKNLLTPLYSFGFMTFASFILKVPIWYALSSHFFIIFSFIFYLEIVTSNKTHLLKYFIAMILVTLLWHVYIFAMCTGIFFATLFQSLNNKDISIKRFLKLGSVLLSSLAFLIYVSGHLYYDIDRSVPLFGTGLIVSNNFNAFFITGSESRSWANQYLGLGFILMAATLFFFIKRQHFQILKKHLWLCLLLASYFLYSLRIVDNILKDSPHFLYTIFDIMRMNSRFVWPVYYISCALAIVIITRSMGKKISLIFLIVFASLLQITDNSFYLKEHDDPHRSSMDKRLDWPFWKNEFKGKEKMFIYPTYSCSYDLTPPSFTQKKSYQLNREFYEIAARTKLISNSILTAKRNKNCTNEKLRGESGVFEKDSIYIYQKENGRNPIKPPKKCLDQNKHFKYGIYCKF